MKMDSHKCRVLRVEKDMLQKDVARLIGVTPWALNMFEKRGLSLPLEAEIKLSRILGLRSAPKGKSQAKRKR